ncbi:hypothetical protein [Streptomyces sp. RerS4]|uniref:hypothetical protein n=1 Tax=Streptomyces sp. RerS4 TaxID=2942449 RepID=UPI00201C0FE8|nr:hypothetical protein [Streptomyces sp. RerS4]UQX01509.1 hypothetical protein M4D82_14050 [Streptomyces sp. RerS4]
MSEIAETPVPVPAPVPAVPTVHEAYSFACMKCGYGWEQAYEIEHHVDGRGEPFIMYTINGERVPSPLANPTCLNCDGHVVRIMREGQVSSVLGTLDRLYHHRVAPGIAGPVPAGAPAPRTPKHDAPGPVAVDAYRERRGPLARLLGLLRRRA